MEEKVDENTVVDDIKAQGSDVKKRVDDTHWILQNQKVEKKLTSLFYACRSRRLKAHTGYAIPLLDFSSETIIHISIHMLGISFM